MLRAIGIPRYDLEDDRLFRLGLVIFRHQRIDQRRIILDHAGLAPDLDAAAIDVVDQENVRLRILGEIALGDVLPVAAEIRESQRRLVENLDEAGGAAAVLDIGLPVSIRRRQEETGLRADEGCKPLIDFRAPAAAIFHVGVAVARALAGLDRLYSGGKGDVA